MSTLKEGKTPGDFLLSEAGQRYSRDEVTIASGADLEPGTVLGIVTANGKYKKSVQNATDGSQTAVAVLYTSAKAEDADVTDAVIIARDAQLRRGGLVFDTSYGTKTKRDAAVAKLKTKGLIAF